MGACGLKNVGTGTKTPVGGGGGGGGEDVVMVVWVENRGVWKRAPFFSSSSMRIYGGYGECRVS